MTWTIFACEPVSNVSYSRTRSVNPFQVKEVYYNVSLSSDENSDETLNFSQAVLDTATMPENVWRDTVFIPDLGFTRIYQRFGGRDIAWAGKTVFHCHFLDHEDQGMISAIMIGDPKQPGVVTDSPQADSPPTDSPPTDSPQTDSSSARSNVMTFAAACALISTSLYTFVM
jgi:hypothetical protein